jgi:TolA-binding protein
LHDVQREVPNEPSASGGTASSRANASTSAPAADAEEAAYRVAHEAHFVAHDPTRALSGWDAYLKAYPNGRFAPDAKYNRALTLIRLDRRDEARAALKPFADGTPGGYRQSEARKLLDALTTE